jgi:hypothetical protein
MVVTLAGMLAVVAPTSMSIDQQDTFLQAVMGALDRLGIRSDEVEAVSAEVLAKIVRHQQMVHAISEAVDAKRKARSTHNPSGDRCPYQPVGGKVTQQMIDWLADKRASMGLDR